MMRGSAGKTTVPSVIVACVFLAFALTGAPLSAQGTGYTLYFSAEVGVVGGDAEVSAQLDCPNAPEDVSGWSFGVCHDEIVEIVSIAQGSTTQSLDPQFFASSVAPGEGWTVAAVISFLGTSSLAPGSGYELEVATYALLEVGVATLEYCNTIGTPPVAVEIGDESGSASNVVLEDGSIEIGNVPPFVLRAGSAEAAPGDPVTIAIEMDNLQAVDGFSFGIAHDAGAVTLLAIEPGAAIASLNGGAGAAFFIVDVAPAGGEGGTVICLMSAANPFDSLPAGVAHEVATLQYNVAPQAADGSVASLEFFGGLGAMPVPVVVAVQGSSEIPVTTAGSIEVNGSPVISEPQLQRGDATADGILDLIDAIRILNWLFGDEEIFCVDAADTNDNGIAALDDAIYLLSYLFLDGAAVPPPAGACGPDSTLDDLNCAAFAACE